MPFAHVNKIQIHYQVHGDGEPLVVLGGLGDNIRNWVMLAVPLAKHFKLILIDNRGAGQSDKPPGPYTINDMAHDTLGVLDHLKIASVHVLGFSMGSHIAMTLALYHPKRVEKLILIAPPSPDKHRLNQLEKNVFDVLDHYAISEEHFAKQFDVLFSERYKKKFTPEMFVKFKMADPNPQPPEAFQAQYAANRSFDISGDIHFIVALTLIIVGTEDRMTSPTHTKWLSENIPHAELKLYDGVGHIPQAEETKKFLTDVVEFLVVRP